MKEDRLRAINAGCNDHLTKPVNAKALVEKVAEFAENKAGVQ